MSEQVFIDEFENDPVALFDARMGFAINAKDKLLRVFDNTISGHWQHFQFKLSDIRKIERIALTPSEWLTTGGSGAQGIGDAIGTAISNSREKAKAAKGTGIKIYLASVDRPSVFISIPEERNREATYEALSQILDGRSPNGTLNQIPQSVRRAFHRPTAEELQRAKKREERNQRRLKAFTPNPQIVIGVLIVALVAIWPTYLVYKEMVFANVGRYPQAPLVEDLSIFFVSWAVIGYALQTAWRFARA